MEIKKQIIHIDSFFKELRELERRGCNDNTIRELESLINRSYSHSKSVVNEPYYENNVRQTISKQLMPLLKYKSMPRKRVPYWVDTVNAFHTDLSMTISYLESSVEDS